MVVYDKLKVKREEVDTYEELADPKNKGKLCIRSGSHPYNLSLFGAMTEHLGPAATEAWLKGMVDNMARAPKGGDTDQTQGSGQRRMRHCSDQHLLLGAFDALDQPRRQSGG